MRKLLLAACFIFLASAACFAQEQPEQSCDCLPEEGVVPASLTIDGSPDCETDITINKPMLYVLDDDGETFMIIIAEQDVLDDLQKEDINEAQMKERLEKARRDFNRAPYVKHSSPATIDLLAMPKFLDFDISTLAELECENFKFFAPGTGQNIMQGGSVPQIIIGKTSAKKRNNTQTAIPLDNGDEIIVIMGIVKGEGAGVRGGGRRINCGFGYNFHNISFNAGISQSIKLSNTGRGGGRGHGGHGGAYSQGPQLKFSIKVKFGCP